MDTIAPNLGEKDGQVEENDPLTCPICNQRFFLKSNLEVHILFCEKNGSVTSKIGGVEKKAVSEPVPVDVESVRDALKLISQTFEYIPMANNSNENKCNSCSRRIPEGKSLSEVDISDLLLNSSKKVFSDQMEAFQCQECSRDFLYKHPVLSKEPVMANHVRLIAKKPSAKPFKCYICNRGFEQQREMLEHELKHTTTPSRYSCAKCNEKFITRDMLQKHYDSDVNSCSPRKCTICEKEFVHANHLRRHLSIHAGIKPFVCSICSHEFNQKSDLQRHEKRHTVDGKLACVKCSLIYDTAEELREHVLTHAANEKDKVIFECEKCNKTFGRKSHYKRHLSIHEGIKPYSCEECGKSFNQRTDLKRHSYSHVRKRELKAMKEQADASVSMVSRNSSSGEFYCRICDKSYSTKALFLSHNLMHGKVMNNREILNTDIIY